MTNVSFLNVQTDDTLVEAFPAVDPGVRPLGSRVLVQVRTPKQKTKGGIILADESRETVLWNTQVGKVIAVGPNAFRDRKTGDLWPEGEWAGPGDFVRIPKYSGDKWQVAVPDSKDEFALFAIFNDADLIGVVTGNPLDLRAYV